MGETDTGIIRDLLPLRSALKLAHDLMDLSKAGRPDGFAKQPPSVFTGSLPSIT